MATQTQPAFKQTHPNSHRIASPDELPDLYAAVGHGTCMEPFFKDGQTFAFQKSAPCQAGDIVGLWWKPEFVPAGEPQQWLKRLVIGVPPSFATFKGFEFLVVVEQLNPHREYQIPCSKILALHRCIGIATKLNGRTVIDRSLIQ